MLRRSSGGGIFKKLAVHYYDLWDRREHCTAPDFTIRLEVYMATSVVVIALIANPDALVSETSWGLQMRQGKHLASNRIGNFTEGSENKNIYSTCFCIHFRRGSVRRGSHAWGELWPCGGRLHAGWMSTQRVEVSRTFYQRTKLRSSAMQTCICGTKFVFVALLRCFCRTTTNVVDKIKVCRTPQYRVFFLHLVSIGNP